MTGYMCACGRSSSCLCELHSPMTDPQTTAGTAGRNFRATPPDHEWAPVQHPEENGLRVSCRHNCGRNKDEHTRGTT